MTAEQPRLCSACACCALCSGLYGSMLVGGKFCIWSQRVCMPTNMITWQDRQISSSKGQWGSLDLCHVVCVCVCIYCMSFFQLIMLSLPAWRKSTLDMRPILNTLPTIATINYRFISTFLFFKYFNWGLAEKKLTKDSCIHNSRSGLRSSSWAGFYIC